MAIRLGRVQTAKLKRKVSPEEAALIPTMLDIPEPPRAERTAGEVAEWEEQQVYRVELLLLKGVTSPRIIGELLDIDTRATVTRFIKRVHARWEMGGSTADHVKHRGAALARLDMIDSELWNRLSKIDNDQGASQQLALNTLSLLMRNQEYRSELLGLTPKVIAHISAGTSGAGDSVANRVTKNDMLLRVLERANHLVQERMRVIDHEETP